MELPSAKLNMRTVIILSLVAALVLGATVAYSIVAVFSGSNEIMGDVAKTSVRRPMSSFVNMSPKVVAPRGEVTLTLECRDRGAGLQCNERAARSAEVYILQFPPSRPPMSEAEAAAQRWEVLPGVLVSTARDDTHGVRITTQPLTGGDFQFQVRIPETINGKALTKDNPDDLGTSHEIIVRLFDKSEQHIATWRILVWIV